MTNSIDGFPVTRHTIEVAESHPTVPVSHADLFTARAVIPVVAMVRVGDLIHVPGDDDNMERVTRIEVTRILIPAGADAERVVDLLRNGPNVPQADDGEGTPVPTQPFASMSDLLSPQELDAEAAAPDPEPDVDVDPDGEANEPSWADFTMPPLPAMPDREVTLRRITPRDSRLSKWVGDGGAPSIVRGED